MIFFFLLWFVLKLVIFINKKKTKKWNKINKTLLHSIALFGKNGNNYYQKNNNIKKYLNISLFKFFKKIIIYDIIVIIIFYWIFYPWINLYTFKFKSFLEVLHRIFPFNHGLFEDKVSNFWVATNLAIHWRERFGN